MSRIKRVHEQIGAVIRHSPAYWRRICHGVEVLHHEGFRVAIKGLRHSMSFIPGNDSIGINSRDYQDFLDKTLLDESAINQARRAINTFDWKPRFSIIVPVFNVDVKWLLKMVHSVQQQIYQNWQLCIVDDASTNIEIKPALVKLAAEDVRIRVRFNEINGGIASASNDALMMADGEFIGLLDHDDEISIDALYENLKAINEHPDVAILYSDEDKIRLDGKHVNPFFKPDYSPQLLESQNYICHFTVIHKDIIDRSGGFRMGFEGSQDHDLILRVIEQSRQLSRPVIHIPRVLYHWRKIPGSTAAVYDSKSYSWEAGRRAVEDHLQRMDEEATVGCGSIEGTYRVKRKIKGNPLVSIIIPFRDHPELLKTCVDSILARTNYTNYEIVAIDNDSQLQQTADVQDELAGRDAKITFTCFNEPFNFSRLCNFGAEKANGEYLLLLNNDIEISSNDWIECLLEYAQLDEIGAVSGKLLYPDGRIQHAGIVVGMVGAAGHPHKFFHKNSAGYFCRLKVASNVSAVTAAMLMVSKQKYNEVGGLNEDSLAIAYNDVDFCLKLMNKEYNNVITPFCQAIHHESSTRGYEDTPEKLDRLKKEKDWLFSQWRNFFKSGDPYYNPNLSLKLENVTLNLDD